MTRNDLVVSGVAFVLALAAVLLSTAQIPLVALALIIALGFVSLVVRPQVAPYVVVVTLLLQEAGSLDLAFGGRQLSVSQLAVAGSLAAWAVRALAIRQPVLIVNELFWPSVAILISMLASLVFADFAMFGIQMALSIIMLLLMLHWLVTVLDQTDFDRFLERVSVLVLLILSAGVVLALDESRATGTFAAPNKWAATVPLVGVPAAVVLAHSRVRWGGLAASAGFAVMLVALATSGSRSGLTSAVSFVPLLWTLRRHPVLLVAMSVGGALVASMFVTEVAVSRVAKLLEFSDLALDFSVEIRLVLVQVSLQLFAEHWLFGVGIGTFGLYSAAYTPDGLPYVPHNEYLRVAAEQGIVGIVAHTLFFGALWVLIWRAWRRSPDQRSREIMLAFAGAIAGFMLNNVFGTYLMRHSAFYFQMAVTVVLAWRILGRAPRPPLVAALARRPDTEKGVA